MKTGKILGILFAFVMVLGMASAVSVTGIPSTLSQNGGSFLMTIGTNSMGDSIEVSIDNALSGITFEIDNSSFVLNDQSKTINVSYQTGGFNFEFPEMYSVILNVEASNSSNYTEEIFFEPNFCEGVANEGKLEIRRMDFTVEEGFGDEDEFWYLMDTISVDVEVKNNGDWDIRNVEVEWELYTTAGDLISDGDVSDLDIDEGEDGTFTINFKLDENIKDFEGENAVLYVRATGEIDEGTYDGDDTCAFDFEEVEVITGDEFMIAEELTLNGEPVERNDFLENSLTCGASVELRGEVFNIGDRDQEDAYIMIYNEEFGILEKIDLSDINAFRSEEFLFNFEIPNDAEEKTYGLEISVYDEDNDIYENGENDESVTKVYFTVEGNCAIAPPTVSAELFSGEAKEGKEVTIKVYLRNEYTKEATFVLGAEGYSSWANLKEIDPITFTLQPGESKEAYITLDLKGNSRGEQQFNLFVTSNGQIVSSNPVILEVESGSFWSNFSSWDVDWQTVGIIALNVILLIAIIIVAVKILRKK